MHDPAEFVVFKFGARLRLRVPLRLGRMSVGQPTKLLYSSQSRQVTLTHCPYAKRCTIQNEFPKMWTQTFAQCAQLRHFPQQRAIGPAPLPPKQPKPSVPNLLLRFRKGHVGRHFHANALGSQHLSGTCTMYDAKYQFSMLSVLKAGAILFG